MEPYFEVPMGEKIARYPIDRYKGSKERKDLITILSKNPTVTRFHYKESVGYFWFNPLAAELGLNVSLRYVFIIAVWETDSKGKLLNPKEPGFSVKYISIGDDLYDDLVDKFQINGDLKKLLLMVKCTDDKYQKLTFNIVGEAPYTKNKELFQSVLDAYRESKPYLIPALGFATLSDDKIREIMDQPLESDKEFESRQQVSKLPVAVKKAISPPVKEEETTAEGFTTAEVSDVPDFDDISDFGSEFDEE